MKKNHSLIYVLPDNINPEHFVEVYDPGATELMRQRHIDAFVFLVGTLYQRTVFFQDESNDPEYVDQRWIYLSASQMKAAVGSDYNSYRDFLIEQGVIICDYEYIPGYKTMGYQFTHDYLYPKKVRYYEIKDFMRRKSIKTFLGEIKKANDKDISNNYAHLKYHFDSGKLQIRGTEARKWIEARRVSGNSGKKSKISPDEFARIHLQFVDHVENKEYNLSPDQSGQRFYSVITNCKRELRNFLHYDGETLVSLDLKNSQPYLFEALFLPRFWEQSGFTFQNLYKNAYHGISKLPPFRKKQALTGEEMTEKEYREIEKEIEKKQIKPVITKLREIRERRLQSGVQAVNLYSLSVDGELYEWFMAHFKGKFMYNDGVDRFGTRDQVKSSVLWLLYLNPRRASRKLEFYAPYREFCKIFPIETTLMNFIKLEKYNVFPLLLQRIESWLILKKVCGKLPKTIPVFTIHDSIVTTIEHADLVEEFMYEVLEKYIGRRPRIARQVWSPANLI
jgi:hypothetical protein